MATLLSASAASAQTFDFETTPLGAPVPLSVTSGGITASFASASNFSIRPSFFSGLTGRTLLDDDPARNPLTITFSEAVSSISFNFGLNAFAAPAGLTLQARNGAAVVGAVTVAGAAPPGFLFFEGVASFAGAAFDSVVLTSTATNFGVDNIRVTTASVIPEPATVALVGVGVLLLSGLTARRRRASA
jgi:hypothetical protein